MSLSPRPKVKHQNTMRKTCPILSAIALCLTAQAQTPAPQRPFVVAQGDATISVQPDEARIQFSVVTMAATAQSAASQNADQVTAVLAALRSVLGPNAQLRTLSYSLNPNYSNGNQPVIIGYTASNTVEARLSDLSLIGRTIDTGIQSGANRVQGLQFGLKDDQPVRLQALKLATVEAKAHADAMASGLGLKTGAPIAIQEGSTVSIQPLRLGTAAPAATTPIETGSVDIRATVTLQVELAP
jgi:uncharacterized protein YggE